MNLTYRVVDEVLWIVILLSKSAPICDGLLTKLPYLCITQLILIVSTSTSTVKQQNNSLIIIDVVSDFHNHCSRERLFIEGYRIS